MILKLLITRGNITLIPKETTQEKEKENSKMQTEKENKKEKQKNYQERKRLAHQPQEGSNRKISIIFPLGFCCCCVSNPSSS